MTCYHPITAIYPSTLNDEGKRPLLFTLPDEYYLTGKNHVLMRKYGEDTIEGFKIKLPCGRCLGCRLDYSRHWAIRSIHEAFMFKKNCFVTLTFNERNIPSDRSVHKEFIQKWLKRFRKYYGEGIRYMLCGEYGEKRGRPHYHILFYNFDFDDKYVFNEVNGNYYYRSPTLEKLWTLPGKSESAGFSVIGDVSFESSAYVARYVTKKIFGKDSKKYYKGKEPEFMLTSRMPGLGNSFLHKYYKDMFNVGFVLLPNGFKAPIPRYYTNILQTIDERLYNSYKIDKYKEMLENLFVDDINSTEERLRVREELKQVRCDRLIRAYEYLTPHELQAQEREFMEQGNTNGLKNILGTFLHNI